MTWRDIPGWPRYQIHKSGAIKSRDMVVGARSGAAAIRKGRILVPVTNQCGYLVVTLTQNNSRRQFLVHRLLAKIFIGPPPDKHRTSVLHSDGNKKNNQIKNLRYGTQGDNNRDTIRHGRRTPSYRKLTPQMVLDIRASVLSAAKVSAKYGVSVSHVHAIRRRVCWTNV